MKRFLAILLVVPICLCLSPICAASASTINSSSTLSSNDIAAITPAINAALLDSSFIDGSIISPQLLSIGEPINTYQILANNTIVKLNFHIIPVFHNGTPIFEIVKTINNEVHVSKSFCATFTKNNNQKVSIVYDQNNAYVVNQHSKSNSLAFSFNTAVTNRGILGAETTALLQSQVTWSSLAPCMAIFEYLTPSITRGDAVFPTITLATGVVRQTSTNICWAASTACIGNYLTSNSYTAQYVAQAFYGSNYNQLATLANSTSILRTLYGINYPNVQTITVPSDYKIYDNIDAGYPMYGRWQSTMTTYHQTVIRGISIQNNCIYVMDPEIGYVTVYLSGGEYSYVAASGLVIRLIGYASKY